MLILITILILSNIIPAGFILVATFTGNGFILFLMKFSALAIIVMDILIPLKYYNII